MSPEDLWVRYGICCGLSLVLALRVASAPAISGLECFWGVALTELDAAHVALLFRSNQKLGQPEGKPQNMGCCLLLGVATQHPVPPAPGRGGTGEGSLGLSGLEKTSFRFALLHLQLHS